jgi:hypothetical protein
MGVAQVGRDDELGHLAPVGLARGVAEDRLGGVVAPDHAPAGVHRHHGVEGRLEHGPQPRLARAHLLGGAAAGHELADLAAERVHRGQQSRVGRAALTLARGEGCPAAYALLREGIASLLRDAGHEVVGRAQDAHDLMFEVRSHVRDVAEFVDAVERVAAGGTAVDQRGRQPPGAGRPGPTRALTRAARSSAA